MECVVCAEPAHLEGAGGNASCVRGHSAALACVARGDAPLHVHWTHRGARLDTASYRWTVTETRAGGALRSKLQLRAAERADAGEYRCHAHNQFGRSEQLHHLHVEGTPRAGAAPAPRAPRSHADGLHTLSARLDGLRPAAAYSLRLTAANHVGVSPHSEPLMFTTLEEAPTASPQNVRVRASNPGELQVLWSAPPQDNWNGELLGYVVTWRELGRFEEEEGSPRAGSACAPGWSSAELLLGGLRSSARYALSLRAYNRAGAGPASPAAYASTADGEPDDAPAQVACEALSPRSLRVRWTPLSAAHALRGYDLHYAPLHFTTSWSGARAGPGAEATLQGLSAATNYSVWVRARADAGLGPPAPPVYCTTADDVPEPVHQVRAQPAGAAAVRVTWLTPAGAHLTHYTLYTRELGKVGGEWAQRVEAAAPESALGGAHEEWREVRGLRERTVYEFWLRAASAAGAGAPSRPVTAAPAPTLMARISSFSRVVVAAVGSRVRLRCAAVGALPLRWRWSPLPGAHTVTDDGDLIIHSLVLARRRQAASCLRRECSLHRACPPHPQLYTTEPSKRNGKTLTPPDLAGELHEISPYATFSMAGGAGGAGGASGAGSSTPSEGGAGGSGAGGCALHLRTFGRAEPLDLAAPPPRPNLLAHTPEYGRSRESDSESSGSPCAACAAELYRVPAAHLSGEPRAPCPASAPRPVLNRLCAADTLPAVESSAEDSVYAPGARAPAPCAPGASAAGPRGTRGRPAPRARRRREHPRHADPPTVR
uniref:Down syndrome cell adhesion molecule-like protein Dscam2 n=1 Tax=Heliothis virescens TaxID=7102 RepID=A0A2A4JGR5_HELVI